MGTVRRESSATEREAAVAARVGALHDIDFSSMNVVQNVYRVANAVRSRMERDVLGESGLSWTSFTALFVLWVWGAQETRHLAEECGVTKGTLTGVIATLESKGLVQRTTPERDGRLVVVSLTPAGRALIRRLFPRFNERETEVVEVLTASEQETLTRLLRKVLRNVESGEATPHSGGPTGKAR
jgi:DNA-binding MarR family transcriptional regulator